MLYLRLTYYQAQNYITLKPSSDSNFRRISVIFDLAPVTSEQQERSVAADLMEISSLYQDVSIFHSSFIAPRLTVFLPSRRCF